MIRTRCLLVAAFLLAGAAPASAQHDVVPREFVNVLFLLSGSDGARGALRVGALSELLHGIAPARGERVIGTLARSTIATSAIAVPGNAADVHAAWERRLEAAGWRPRAERPDEQRRGFVPAQEPSRAQTWCWPDDDNSVSLRTIDAPGDETYVVFSLTPGGGSSLCRQPDRMDGPRSPIEDHLPALPAPPGTRVWSTGSSGGGNSVNQRALLHTGMTVAALLEHYAGLMRRQGWEQVDAAVGGSVGVHVWRRSGDDGRGRIGWLNGVRLPDGTVSMEVTVQLDVGS
jgi:hypothetical protein